MSIAYTHRVPLFFCVCRRNVLSRMNKDGLFKFMQITDMQEIPKVSPDTMALLDAAIEDEKPDLVRVYPATENQRIWSVVQGKGERT